MSFQPLEWRCAYYAALCHTLRSNTLLLPYCLLTSHALLSITVVRIQRVIWEELKRRSQRRRAPRALYTCQAVTHRCRLYGDTSVRSRKIPGATITLDSLASAFVYEASNSSMMCLLYSTELPPMYFILYLSCTDWIVSRGPGPR